MVELENLPIEFALDHIGVAVNTLEEGFQFYQALGFTKLSTEVVESEKVKVGMIELANSCRIELLESLSEDGPVAKFIQKRGTGIHHVCLRVGDVQTCIDQLKSKGYKMINDEPKRGGSQLYGGFCSS
ncbi:MAG: VOC family protein [Bdellovibrionales bacterium]